MLAINGEANLDKKKLNGFENATLGIAGFQSGALNRFQTKGQSWRPKWCAAKSPSRRAVLSGPGSVAGWVGSPGDAAREWIAPASVVAGRNLSGATVWLPSEKGGAQLIR